MNSFPRVLSRLEDWLNYVAMATLVAVTAAVCLSVLMRYAFGTESLWVVELTEYALLYITFLGAPLVLRLKEHVSDDVLLRMLPAAARRRLEAATSALGCAACFVLCYAGAATTWSAYVRGAFRPTINEVPAWIVMIAVPAGSLLLALRFAMQFSEHARTGRDTTAAGT